VRGPRFSVQDAALALLPAARARGPVRTDLIRAAGVVIILMSAGAALLPFLGPVPGTVAIGLLLFLAGNVEMWAARWRREARRLAIAAGATTAVAGLFFFLNATGELLSSASVVVGWLFVRAGVLLMTSRVTDGSVRMWIWISALTDSVLGLALIAGVSVVALVTTLFGPAPDVIASFAWVVALSFVASGTLLLEVAGSETTGERGLG
jgi:uncharacterized membrane protein HdeD (DUF308 family)